MAGLVFDLTAANRYHVQGSYLFEDGIVQEGYVAPVTPRYIDMPRCRPEQKVSHTEEGRQEQGPLLHMEKKCGLRPAIINQPLH